MMKGRPRWWSGRRWRPSWWRGKLTRRKVVWATWGWRTVLRPKGRREVRIVFLFVLFRGIRRHRRLCRATGTIAVAVFMFVMVTGRRRRTVVVLFRGIRRNRGLCEATGTMAMAVPVMDMGRTTMVVVVVGMMTVVVWAVMMVVGMMRRRTVVVVMVVMMSVPWVLASVSANTAVGVGFSRIIF